MKTFLFTFFTAILALSPIVNAQDRADMGSAGGGSSEGGRVEMCSASEDCNSSDVPEFNAGTAALGLALLISIGTLVRERRRK